MSNKKGFTLVELLVTISVIGILASVVLVNVSSAKGKAEKTNALSTLRSAQAAATNCVIGGGAALTSPVVVGAALCSNTTEESSKWPKLPANWSYVTATTTDERDNFSMKASSGTSGSVTCDINGCVTGN